MQGQKVKRYGGGKKGDVCRDDQFEKVKNPGVKGTGNTRTRTAKSQAQLSLNISNLDK